MEEARRQQPEASLAAAGLQLLAGYDSLRLRTYQERERQGHRIQVGSVGRATALRFDDIRYFNRVYSPDRSVAERLQEIEQFYDGCGFGCELLGPEFRFAGEVGRACQHRGWSSGERYAWMYAAAPGSIESNTPHPFTIRRPEVDDRTRFLLTYLRGFEAHPDRFDAALQNMRHLFDLPELQFLMAWKGDQPAGIGMICRAGKSALLCAGATLPEFRRRGCHTALLAERIRTAREQGCEEIFAWTNFGSQSQANMERVGLRTVGVTEACRLDYGKTHVKPRPPIRSEHAADNGFEPRSGFRPFSPEEAESTIGTRFRETVLRCANSVALVDGPDRFTYEELLRCSASIANGLTAKLGKTGGIVGIFLPFGHQAVTAILGTLVGGFQYFPIEPSLSDRQIDEQARAANLVGVIAGETSRGHFERAAPGCRAEIIEIAELLREDGAPPHIAGGQPVSTAALYATSGSTGTPKLVALPHRAILFDIGRQTNDLYLGPDDRFDLLFSFAFSASLAPMFGALLNGAELHLLDARESLEGLGEWLERSRISISTMTVSMLRSVCTTSRRTGICPSMRLLSVGGEPLLGRDVQAFRSIFAPSCVLQNAMAATETRTYAQFFVPRSGPVPDTPPIGWPVHGKQVLLVDELDVPVKDGEEGEIAVRSRYLASCYSNDPELTSAKFLPAEDGAVLYRTGDRGRRSSDGSLLFLGRADSQVKIRGHRVELEAIERMLGRSPGVRQSVVVAQNDLRGEARIVAYVVPQSPDNLSVEQLRRSLQAELPEYMVPWSFVILDTLPLTPNGKVDRERLPKPSGLADTVTTGSVVPPDSTVAALLEIWSKALQKPCVGVQENFYDLGGDSLSTLRLLVDIQERFRCDLPPGSLRQYPTIEQLARFIDATVEGKTARRRLQIFNVNGSRAPIFFVHPIGGSAHGYRPLALNLGPDRPSYGLNARLWETVDPRLSIESLASEYIDEISVAIEPGERVVLAGYSLGATIAFEMARQMALSGEEPPLLVIIDMPAINAPNGHKRSWPRAAFDFVSNVPSWLMHHALRFHPKTVFIRAQGRIAMALAKEPQFDPRVYFGVAKLPAIYHAFYNAMYQALVQYVPGKYPGRIVLLRTKVPTLFRDRDRQMGWQSVAGGGVEVLTVPGSHMTCLMEPQIFDLAAILKQRLDRAEST